MIATLGTTMILAAALVAQHPAGGAASAPRCRPRKSRGSSPDT